jgi:hypothetical protein
MDLRLFAKITFLLLPPLVLMGFEEFYNEDTVLLLKKGLYGLKQVAMAFYRKLLASDAIIGLKQSSVDPCLY